MQVSDGQLVFGHWHSAKTFAEHSIDQVHWPNVPDKVPPGGTVVQNQVSFLVRALNGTWDQIPLYPDADSHTPCGSLFRHVEDFNAPEKAIIDMERAGGLVVCNNAPAAVLSQGVHFVGRYDWQWWTTQETPFQYDLDDFGEYCLIGSRDSVRGTANRHEAKENGALLAEFKNQEYLFGRLWFAEDGLLRSLLVYTYNTPQTFADCRLGISMLAPKLDFSQPNDQLERAVTARHGSAVMEKAIDEDAVERVCSFFPNRSLPLHFLLCALPRLDNRVQYGHVQYERALVYDKAMADVFDVMDESNMDALRTLYPGLHNFDLNMILPFPALLSAMWVAGVLPKTAKIDTESEADLPALPLVDYALQQLMNDEKPVVMVANSVKALLDTGCNFNTGLTAREFMNRELHAEDDPETIAMMAEKGFVMRRYSYTTDEFAALREKLSIPSPTLPLFYEIAGAFIGRPVDPRHWSVRSMKNLKNRLEFEYRTRIQASSSEPVPFELIRDEFVDQAVGMFPPFLMKYAKTHFGDDSLDDLPDDTAASVIVHKALRNGLIST